MKFAAVLLGGLGLAAALFGRVRLVIDSRYAPATPVRLTPGANTVVARGLEAPVGIGKSVIWSGALALTWHRAEQDVFGGPPSVAGADALIRSLGATVIEEGDVAPGSLDIRVTRGDEGPDAIRIDALLSLAGRFAKPYLDSEEPLVFRGADGATSNVRSFGIRPKDAFTYSSLRKQIRVLYRAGGGDPEQPNVGQFAVDLSQTSAPYQVIVAAISPRPTLQAAVEYLREHVAQYAASGGESTFGENDVLLVPEQAWELDDTIGELEGKTAQGPRGAVVIRSAREKIQFRLDRSGAEVRVRVDMRMYPVPARYILDRPFLVMIRRRGREAPIFVEWVGNGELLRKWDRARTSTN